MPINAKQLKEKLLEEKRTLEMELQTVARRNPQNPRDWEPAPSVGERPAERDEVADKLESFEENLAITRQLEARFDEINNALDRIETGSYGTCAVCGKEIEEARLRANPAAITCKTHMK